MPNERQREAIAASSDVPLLVVAGPGTGKTTTLVLRALRFTFVDGIAPEDVLITTFTEKAGREIRSRLIEWGTRLRAHLVAVAAAAGDEKHVRHLSTMDVNRYIAGTLDSICEDAVRDMREPNEASPVILEQSASRAILYRRGEVWSELRTLGDPLRAYLGRYGFTGDPVRNNGEATEIVRTIIDRLVQDLVDLNAYGAPHSDQEFRQAILRIKNRYEQHLAGSNQMDFALLERRFLDRLRAGRIPRSMHSLRMVMVDEYQDTNPLQEAIYFELVRRTGASLTVVGDDDQSLYRFRGATIELFRDFRDRAQQELGCPEPQLVCLEENYRSSKQIVEFFSAHVTNDPDFAGARVPLPAPYVRRVISTAGAAPIGVIGMFRNDAPTLAADLADFLHRVFRQGGRFPLPHEDTLTEPILPADGGDLGDAVLLASTVAERGRPFRGTPGKERLPLHLRRELEARGLAVFNPRGRALRDVDIVQRFLGLALVCIDPSPAPGLRGERQQQAFLTNEANDFLDQWRAAAEAMLTVNPRSPRGELLSAKVERWRLFAVHGEGDETEWPLLDICYSFLPWFPPFQDDPEAQVYLEAITRTVAAASTFSGYKATIQRDEPHRHRSVNSAIRDVLNPIAEDLVQVDEEIMPSVPRDRLNIMTIHQAKGLEYPLVIVDVSSDFKTNNARQRFRRFPDEESSVVRLENDLTLVTPVGPARGQRTGMQRTFEDLVRLYYVAYSRPQSLLMLVGCQQGLQFRTKIKNVAKFWRRDESWAWLSDPALRPPPVDADHLPFVRI
ncbi:ATP-dependent helicase [Rubellimicrobium roseum]|uniref:DNA 3'-5' helicase n=1 Tax=Rubellimicrobium roseum TaxID=687525 RepID=A0A5C4NHV0_9RHOB|nr:ATP-dependent helicase [Rubellimicrobium roseum]TNC74341.1 ATP-dependent helicase [Rubellimicrobium roseum]